jgi:hypothetical protein
MNKIDFTQPGGFPLDQEVLDLLQDNSELAGSAALLGGDFCILSGCVIIGESAGNGRVVVAGEPLPFVGGVISAKVIIVEATNILSFEDGSDKGVEKIRYATFGDDGVTNYLWVNFKRNTPSNGLLARVELLEMVLKPLMPYTVDAVVVHGSRLEWNRPAIEIPVGWAADDSEEVKGRMPVGYKAGDVDFGAVGNTGGAKTHTLTEGELPVVELNLSLRRSNNNYGLGTDNGPIIDTANPSLNQKVTFGGGQSHSILNPFRVVRYIIFVGV